MSPLWRDEIGILLAPGKLVLTRMSRGLRPVCVRHQTIVVDDGSFTDFGAALSVLARELTLADWRNANARVLVSDQWVRYSVVPWSDELRGARERAAHARLFLERTYGASSEDWTVTLSDVEPGRSQVAAALPTALLAQLESVLSGRAGPAVSIQPQLLATYNVWRHRLPASGCWFVCIDDGSFAAAQISPEGWQRVQSVRIGSDWPAELRRLVKFSRLAAQGAAEQGLMAQTVYVDAPMALRLGAEADSIDGLEWLVTENTPRATVEKLVQLKGMYA